MASKMPMTIKNKLSIGALKKTIVLNLMNKFTKNPSSSSSKNAASSNMNAYEWWMYSTISNVYKYAQVFMNDASFISIQESNQKVLGAGFQPSLDVVFCIFLSWVACSPADLFWLDYSTNEVSLLIVATYIFIAFLTLFLSILFLTLVLLVLSYSFNQMRWNLKWEAATIWHSFISKRN